MLFDRPLALVTNFMVSLNVLFWICFHIYIQPCEDKMFHFYADDTHLYWSVWPDSAARLYNMENWKYISKFEWMN